MRELTSLRLKRAIAVAVFCLGAVAGWVSPASAQKVVAPSPGLPGTWKQIGRTQAMHTVDHDAIVVVGPFDNFRRVKFKVTDAPLHILRMVVTYDNGAPDRLDVRQRIPQGGESRAINLRGVGKRSLRKVEFWYETKGWLRGKADVTLFGMK